MNSVYQRIDFFGKIKILTFEKNLTHKSGPEADKKAMGWIFIFVRTFPFWALPLGIALITGWWASKRRKNAQGRSIFWALLGLALVGGSGAFLFFQGHFTAVPFVHELIRGPASDY